MSGCIKEKFCSNKKIQGHRLIVTHQENYHARSQNPQTNEPPKHCRIEGSLPKKRHRLPSFLVRRK